MFWLRAQISHLKANRLLRKAIILLHNFWRLSSLSELALLETVLGEWYNKDNEEPAGQLPVLITSRLSSNRVTKIQHYVSDNHPKLCSIFQTLDFRGVLLRFPYMRSFLALILLTFLGVVLSQGNDARPPLGFVQSKNGKFVLNGKPFVRMVSWITANILMVSQNFVGANSYVSWMDEENMINT